MLGVTVRDIGGPRNSLRQRAKRDQAVTHRSASSREAVRGITHLAGIPRQRPDLHRQIRVVMKRVPATVR
jgi:hypothetical protein